MTTHVAYVREPALNCVVWTPVSIEDTVDYKPRDIRWATTEEEMLEQLRSELQLPEEEFRDRVWEYRRGWSGVGGGRGQITVWRARRFDNATEEVLRQYPEGVVVNGRPHELPPGFACTGYYGNYFVRFDPLYNASRAQRSLKLAAANARKGKVGRKQLAHLMNMLARRAKDNRPVWYDTCFSTLIHNFKVNPTLTEIPTFAKAFHTIAGGPHWRRHKDWRPLIAQVLPAMQAPNVARPVKQWFWREARALRLPIPKKVA